MREFLMSIPVKQTRTYDAWRVTCTHPDMYRITRIDGKEFMYGIDRSTEWYGRSDSIVFVMRDARVTEN